jgi:hypothetical protein
MFVRVEANVKAVSVKRAPARGRRHNEHRIKQAVRGIKEMLRRDGLLARAA